MGWHGHRAFCARRSGHGLGLKDIPDSRVVRHSCDTSLQHNRRLVQGRVSKGCSQRRVVEANDQCPLAWHKIWWLWMVAERSAKVGQKREF